MHQKDTVKHMNNLIDAVNQWANRLTIRLLMLAGTPKDQINRVLTAMNNRNTALNEADKKLKGKFAWVKWLILSLIIVAGIFITLKIKKLRK